MKELLKSQVQCAVPAQDKGSARARFVQLALVMCEQDYKFNCGTGRQLWDMGHGLKS